MPHLPKMYQFFCSDDRFNQRAPETFLSLLVRTRQYACDMLASPPSSKASAVPSEFTRRIIKKNVSRLLRKGILSAESQFESANIIEKYC